MLITNAVPTGRPYKNGDIFRTNIVNGLGAIWVNEHGILIHANEYEAIVDNEVKNEEVDEMERYNTAVETARDAIEELRLAAYAKGYEDARRELMEQEPKAEEFPLKISDGDIESAIKEARRYRAQERRDEIVEQAKADVERLRMINRMLQTFDITFDINRESRTVEAVAKKPNSRTAFYGTAICAPDDCFNIHIGEAIALHRALGLEVPDEYLNAPQPTEVRVGDVVAYRGVYKTIDYVTVVADGEPTGGGRAALTSIAVKRGKIIDDSRTGVGE
ncbi:hypothetical protein [Bacillus licheniformis]|uniref:hypothetical protein n=1 Tax=Bacillus licheniformis TaxID=1402 RepID=UPI00211C39C6|nr:hypothetical protein [Bacillus licheniformis]